MSHRVVPKAFVANRITPGYILSSIPSQPPLVVACLRVLAELGIPRSAESLMAGVPQNEALTPELLVRACAQSQLDATLIALPYEAVIHHQAPLILELDDDEDDAAVAVVEPSRRTGLARITVFDGQGCEVDADDAAQIVRRAYTGRCILVRQQGVEVRQERQAHQSARFSVWLRQILGEQRSLIRDLLLASLLINLFVLVTPLFTMNVYDRVVPNQAIETLWVLAIGVGLVLLFDLLVKLVRHALVESAGQRLEVVLSARLLQQLMAIKSQSLPTELGGLANRFREFENLRHLFSASTLVTLVDLPFAVLFFILIFSLGGPIVWVPVLAALVVIAHGLLTHWRLRGISLASQAVASEKQAKLVESLACIETLKAFNAQGRAQGEWERCVARLAELNQRNRRLVDTLTSVAQCVMQLAVVATLVAGVYQVGQHAMSLGGLIACVLLTSRALAPMLNVAHVSAQLWQARQALRVLNELCALPAEHADDKQPVHHAHWRGEIAFEDVSFAYESEREVLKGINLRIAPGEHLALIGRVGSGKSTLFRLLMGFADASRGQVRVDGIDVRHLDPVELRQATAFVPQEVRLIRGTLRDNLALKAPGIADAKLLEVVDQAGLGGLVQGHPLGLDMPVDEAGANLSGGQKQALAIARALLGEPRILLFDELTSAMDNQTEQEVIAAIRQFSKDRTLVLSTHRSALLALVDRIVVLDQGRVVADGPKDNVLDALKKGLIHTSRSAQESAKENAPNRTQERPQ